MKLTELSPQWLSEDMFIFKNPLGGRYWLTCKRTIITRREQCILASKVKELHEGNVVMTNPEMAWNFTGNDFETITVTPSIDASASGNWHGFITNGEIV